MIVDILKSTVIGAILLAIGLTLVAIAIYVFQWVLSIKLGEQIVGYILLAIVVIVLVYAAYRLGESIRYDF